MASPEFVCLSVSPIPCCALVGLVITPTRPAGVAVKDEKKRTRNNFRPDALTFAWGGNSSGLRGRTTMTVIQRTVSRLRDGR